MKIEECVKKGKEHHEEILQRAVAAEVTTNQKLTRYTKNREVNPNTTLMKIIKPKQEIKRRKKE